jgi:putative multicomponent Na+:H+ antiporter subunit B
MVMPSDPSLFSLNSSVALLLPISALLPLVAVLMVSQNNPYQTLPLRGVFGSVATLLYGLLGAPDVALTEALVGTLLSTTLYVIALRSSMTLRLEDRRSRPPHSAGDVEDPERNALSSWLKPLHLRLQLVRGGQAPHGWLEDERQLVIHHAHLERHLSRQGGHQLWLKQGGSLRLQEQEPQ